MAKGKYEYWLTDDGLTLLQGWARDGLVDEQIAANMGVARETLRVYKNTYPVISAALKKGKEIIDIEVENALLKKALSGDTVAQLFWLKNRRPDKWRDKPEPTKDIVDASVSAALAELAEMIRTPAPNRDLPETEGANNE